MCDKCAHLTPFLELTMHRYAAFIPYYHLSAEMSFVKLYLYRAIQFMSIILSEWFCVNFVVELSITNVSICLSTSHFFSC